MGGVQLYVKCVCIIMGRVQGVFSLSPAVGGLVALAGGT